MSNCCWFDHLSPSTPVRFRLLSGYQWSCLAGRPSFAENFRYWWSGAQRGHRPSTQLMAIVHLLTGCSSDLTSAWWSAAEAPGAKSAGYARAQSRSLENRSTAPASPHSPEAPLFTCAAPLIHFWICQTSRWSFWAAQTSHRAGSRVVYSLQESSLTVHHEPWADRSTFGPPWIGTRSSASDLKSQYTGL